VPGGFSGRLVNVAERLLRLSLQRVWKGWRHLYVSPLYGNVLLFLIEYASVESSQFPNREPFCEHN
jgi:hypothetical protein